MLRTARMFIALALTLALAAPALASDMFPPSPVPSSRDRGTTQAKPSKKKLSDALSNAKAPDKIVKTTKGTTGTNGAIKATGSIQ